MTETNWIGDEQRLGALAQELADSDWIGIDTEFLRVRTFFPRLCLVQISAPRGLWLVDALGMRDLDLLVPVFGAARTRKIAHAARQDLEALFLTTHQVPAPVFDTQIAAGCAGLKAQIGYADLCDTLLGVHVGKSQTRTDWSRRPLSRAQLDYAAQDVQHLQAITSVLAERLDQLGRSAWVAEDCALLSDPALYESDTEQAWQRLKGLDQMHPGARGIARDLATWREQQARARNLPRSWVLSDAGLIGLSRQAPADEAAARFAAPECANWRDPVLRSLLEVMARSRPATEPALSIEEIRPTPVQKDLIQRLARMVDERARALGISPEILATRGELRALVMHETKRSSPQMPCLRGWRREQIGNDLLAMLGE
ncbi:MAG: ribonuclease D [Proteobacteria bacterium]|nr:ribonuclease D [Pseudomonadota bacterium]